MRLLTTILVCLGLVLTVLSAGIPPASLTTALNANPTGDKGPDLIDPNMAPIVSEVPHPPEVPPSDACGKAVQLPWVTSSWIRPGPCRHFVDTNEDVSLIYAPLIMFINDGYKNCKRCSFFHETHCRGESWRDINIPSTPWGLAFPGDKPYSYQCVA